MHSAPTISVQSGQSGIGVTRLKRVERVTKSLSLCYRKECDGDPVIVSSYEKVPSGGSSKESGVKLTV